MKHIKTLTTTKRTYKDIQVFDTSQEARAAGYHVLYHDERAEVTIYGKPIDESFPRLLIPAAILDGVQENK